LIYLHKEAGDAHVEPFMTTSHSPAPGTHLTLGGRASPPKRGLHGTDSAHEYLELGFPLPYFLVFVGYTFILLIDKVMFDSHALAHDHEDNKWRESFRKSLIESDTRMRSSSHADFEAEVNGNVKSDNKKSYNEFRDEDEPEVQENEEDDVINEQIRKYLSKADRFSARLDSELAQKYKKGRKNRRNSQMKSNTGDPNSKGMMGQRREFMQDNIEIVDNSKGRGWDLTPYILMIALSVHSVFEGIAVGLQDDPADIWSFLIAIGTHKWAAAMSLGISMSSNLRHSPTQVKILILMFALATPIGIVIGMIAMESSDLINIAFSSLAGGTFLYIAASEVVVEEFSVPTKKWVKLAGFILGALIITFVTELENE